MTPAARVNTAIELLDAILGGAAAESCLTSWARKNRYAGSSDRAQIRSHVYDTLRCLRSFAGMGGAGPDAPINGRRLMIGALRDAGADLGAIFTGTDYGPAALTASEAAELPTLPSWGDLPELAALDCPDWLAPALRRSLGPAFGPAMAAMRKRAAVFVRVNLARVSVEGAEVALRAEGIETRTHPLASTALEVTRNAPRLRNSVAYRGGLVELQDVASQAIVEMLPLAGRDRILDFCAGGGGKTLAMAARHPAEYFVHDAAPERMKDLGPRAARAGIEVHEIATEHLAAEMPFDLVLADVPCSGSGTWRRSPEAKWTLNRARLDALVALQQRVLDQAAARVAQDGVLAYSTCSLLAEENGDQVRGFLDRNPGWVQITERMFTPADGGDGFYAAVLGRS